MLRYVAFTARAFLGIVLVGSVLARVFAPQFVAESTSFSPDGQAWLDVMQETGYLQTLVYATEFVVGVLLLAGRFVPLALVVFAPVNLNIALFHLALAPGPGRIVLISLMLVAHLLLVYRYRRAFEPLFGAVVPRWSGFTFGPVSLRVALQVLLGLVLVLSGGAKLLVPGQLSVGDFLIDSMKATGYLYSLLGTAEVAAGLTLLVGRFVPLALLVLAPVTLNIVAYHLFLEPAGLPAGLALLTVHGALATAYSPAYRPLLGMSGGEKPSNKKSSNSRKLSDEKLNNERKG